MLMNLLPHRSYRTNQRRKRLVITCFIIAIALSILILYFRHQLQQATQLNQQRTLNYQQLAKQLQRQQDHHQCSTIRSVLSQQSALQKRFKQQHCLTQLLTQVTQIIPTSIILNRLSQHSNQLTLTGHSTSAKPLHQLIDKLNKLTSLTQCEMTSINHAMHLNQFDFEIHGEITCLDKTT